MIRQIRYFQSVVRNRSFTEAADECYISQSAMSQQIRSLENELGVQLIEREGRKFSLTEAGEHFYQRSLILIDDFDRLCLQTRRIAQKEKKVLRVGYLRGYAGPEFFQAVARSSKLYPDISLDLFSGNHEELYQELITERLDLVLSDQRRAFASGYHNVILSERPCCIEVAANNPLASMEKVDIEDLKNQVCILIASPLQQNTERTYYQEYVGISSDIEFTDNIEEARLKVLNNQGYLFVEGAAQSEMIYGVLVHIPVFHHGIPLTRNYCAFWSRENASSYAQDFARILQEQFV